MSDSAPCAAAAPRGVCPVKAEYVRPAPTRVTLDAEGRTRGMNKGVERQRSCAVEGTQRPAFEGESNFFHGETLQRVKAVVRQCGAGAKRARDGAKQEEKEKDNQRPPTEEEASVTATGAAEDCGSHAERTAVPHTNTEPGDVTKGGEFPRTGGSEENMREGRARRRALFENKLVLAPLTTVGNLPFRRVCKGYGADVTVSEMAIVHNLNRLQKGEWSLLRRHASEDIFGLQIAVSRPQDAVTWAQAIATSGYSYDFVDINCGCPVERLVLSGCGCGLWERKGNRLRDVVRSLAQHQSKPVSIKCRIGPDEEAPLLHKQIAEYEGWGADAVTVHGRSRKQRYTKLANWAYVEDCAARTALPVTGNGDIFSYEDVLDHRARCPHVSSYMIGRGALIKPWIFEEIKTEQPRDISSHERFEMLRRFCDYGLSHWGSDERGVLTTRRFLCEWLSFLYRYVPVGLLERLPQRINERPPYYEGRDELETLMASDSVADWIRISELLLGPAGEKFRFTPKHRSNSYATPGAAGEGEMQVEG
ncbi:tRNA-dihydrouridine synthase 3 [Trypanosoma conorhini]|uniref:tRNA-dihydrouridine(47) synthase [NAD(P)(+)] n=1 Tax=Trypanosoma conorhini TaxID=83891 RepID=A0A422NPI8_9TRYP|nr:tRNA-dihydrouridine synthase 3 [Trypanosoma conorhini]RNF07420.1 tRNA-dihydrouridine synthase 3 [Trypanosoma conorhini]